ncbi:TPA: type II toxin-antitoxin system RelE/ParE family toxin [Salmonella enterica subsp. enterica serovar Bullbay]
MTYKLAFNESALKEWKKLGHTIQEQFKKKPRERLENPRVPASQLHGRKDQYNYMYRFYFIHPYPSSCMINMQSPNISN